MRATFLAAALAGSTGSLSAFGHASLKVPNLASSSGALMNTYVITETGRHSSLDPLDADSTQNLPVARMIYATPLEMGANERLTSSVLESFSYSTDKREIVWTVRKGLKFEDGKDMTAEDVAFSVARMAYARPRFPVIKEIEGVALWAQSKGALAGYPSGISVRGNVIRIKLSESVDHPLFRFALELFSVIPKSCVDLASNKLTCQRPPASGYYKIVDESEEGIRFERRANVPAPDSAPRADIIRFRYYSPQQVLAGVPGVDESYVISGNETSFSAEEMSRFEKEYQVRNLPKSRFSELSLSPKSSAFQSADCRKLFLEKFRESLVESGMASHEVEASLTSKVLPGYLSLQDLARKAAPLSPAVRSACEAILRRERIEFGV